MNKTEIESLKNFIDWFSPNAKTNKKVTKIVDELVKENERLQREVRFTEDSVNRKCHENYDAGYQKGYYAGMNRAGIK